MSSARSSSAIEFKANLDQLEMRVATEIVARSLGSVDVLLYEAILRSGTRSPLEAYEEIRVFNAIPIIRTKYTNAWLKRKLFRVWWAMRVKGTI